MKKLLFMLIVVAGILFMLPDKNPVTKKAALSIDAGAVILIDAETGKVLYEDNSKEALPIASMSKMMTQYIVLTAIQNNTLDWESPYEPSEKVVQMSKQKGVVGLGMTPGNSYTLKELFSAMTVNSSNDAAVGLAEMVSGTESSFVELMNAQAKTFGLKETTFYNASGLDGDFVGQTKEETNHASARDVAVISQKLLAHFPEVLSFTQLTSFTTTDGKELWNTNQFLPGMPEAFAGIDGLKTGYTTLAGPCFASTGVFDDKRFISVVMNVEKDGEDRIHPKFALTKELFEKYVLE